MASIHVQPVRYSLNFANLLLTVCRIMVSIAVLANGAVLLVGLSSSGSAKAAAYGTMGGFNILTQLHLCFLGPYIGISLRRGLPWRNLTILLGLALLARGILLADRMALMEMALPLIVILCLYKRLRFSWIGLILVVLSVPMFFVVAELFRSFYAKFVRVGGWNQVDPWFAIGWNLERFFVYYIDVLNKFYFTLEAGLSGTSRYWLGGIASIASNFGLAENPKKQPFTQLSLLVEGHGVRTPEMTNFGGLTQLYSDFGGWGLPVYCSFVMILFLSHAGASRGNMLCLGLYPVFFVTFADFARRILFYESRALFPLIAFLLAYGVIRLLASGTVQYFFTSSFLGSRSISKES